MGTTPGRGHSKCKSGKGECRWHGEEGVRNAAWQGVGRDMMESLEQFAGAT